MPNANRIAKATPGAKPTDLGRYLDHEIGLALALILLGRKRVQCSCQIELLRPSKGDSSLDTILAQRTQIYALAGASVSVAGYSAISILTVIIEVHKYSAFRMY
jgi:hypothetical protein